VLSLLKKSKYLFEASLIPPRNINILSYPSFGVRVALIKFVIFSMYSSYSEASVATSVAAFVATSVVCVSV
jgi:hypothetical protein